MLKIMTSLILLIAIGFGGLMIWKSIKSHSMEGQVGLVDGQLRACGQKPNCVSSSAEKNSSFYIEPISSDNIEETWEKLNQLIIDMNFKTVTSTTGYIHATQSTKLMRFVDDIEFLLDINNNKIQIRSASRVGYSDMGANRKRLNKLKNTLTAL